MTQPEATTEADFALPGTPEAHVELGTVGWDDRDDHFDAGDDDNDGYTLVFVQLYRGRGADGRQGLDPKVAHGLKLQCVLADHLASVPPKGSRCYVLLPAGHERTPGAGVITAVVNRRPKLSSNLTNGDYEIRVPGSQARVLVKLDGSISLFTTSDNTEDGKSVYLQMKGDGFALVGPWGTIRWGDAGFHLLHASGAAIDLGGIFGMPAPLDQITSYIRLIAGAVSTQTSAQSLGVGTADNLTKLTPVLVALQDLANATETAIAATGAVGSAAAATAFHLATAPIIAAITADGPATTSSS